MQTRNDNPAGNCLPAGLSEQDVEAAITASGYPLQSIVAAYLRTEFRVREEWSFIDPETKDLRALDILASKLFWNPKTEPQPRVRPNVDLLIECKQSSLPYIFFLAPGKEYLMHFPIIAGLRGDSITITSDDDPSRWTLSTIHALGLLQHPFVNSPPACASTFSKCVRKGQSVELSGSESFQSLMLPLTKAIQHHMRATKPASTAWYFDYHATIAVGVVDAPMVCVSVGERGNQLTLQPWVRVSRHEAYDAEERAERSKVFAIDVVHKDFFTEYVERHVLPFGKAVKAAVIKHQNVIATGRAFAKGMGADPWNNLDERLEEISQTKRAHRARLILRNVIRFLTFRGPEEGPFSRNRDAKKLRH